MDLLSPVGNNLLVPPLPDISPLVISTSSGHAWANQSWILGRILRDFELCWMTSDVRDGVSTLLERKKTTKAGL